MRLEVLLFGPARDLAGGERIDLDLPEDATVAMAAEALAERCPPLAPALSSVRFAVNRTFAEADRQLRPGDELAVIPPVSGG
jgi:molybdopterin converting factor subunit 1